MLKLISCNVFLREACWCIARSPHAIDPEFTELGEHARSDGLRSLLQANVDAAEDCGKNYEAILLLFGLCGNSTIGITARKTRLIIPRAHDCCTILLGSRQKFQEHFGDNPSTPFGSSGYVERGEYVFRADQGGRMFVGDVYAQYVEQYGEDNARFLWEELHAHQAGAEDRAVFIDIPEMSSLGHGDYFRQKAEALGKKAERVEGSLRLIRDLIDGRWNEQEFLIVPPGHKVAGVYDWNEVIRAVPG